MNICQKFGNRVREKREKLEWSQEELADRSGLHRTYISGIERGKRNPTLVTITTIANSLGVTPEELIAETENINM